jgi:hypothetical protein
MKQQSFRSMIATASLVLGFSGVGSAQADIFGGFLGAAASAGCLCHDVSGWYH